MYRSTRRTIVVAFAATSVAVALATPATAQDAKTVIGGGVGAAAGAAIGDAVGGSTGSVIGGAVGGAVGGAATTRGPARSGAIVGGAVGGASGAAVGRSVGGGTGAVVGAGVGGAAGSAIGAAVTDRPKTTVVHERVHTREVVHVRERPGKRRGHHKHRSVPGHG